MSDEHVSDGLTEKERERDRKQREHIAKIERRERLKGCIENVWLTYQLLAHRAEPDSGEQQEFTRLRRYYVDVQKRKGSLSEEEQDRILEEYPKLVARLEKEHGL